MYICPSLISHFAISLCKLLLFVQGLKVKRDPSVLHQILRQELCSQDIVVICYPFPIKKKKKDFSLTR